MTSWGLVVAEGGRSCAPSSKTRGGELQIGSEVKRAISAIGGEANGMFGSGLCDTIVAIDRQPASQMLRREIRMIVCNPDHTIKACLAPIRLSNHQANQRTFDFRHPVRYTIYPLAASTRTRSKVYTKSETHTKRKTHEKSTTTMLHL
jgi:hypothetical protein